MGTVFDYKTHILIGVRVSGTMEILYQWLRVPTQAEVQAWIDAASRVYSLRAVHADFDPRALGARGMKRASWDSHIRVTSATSVALAMLFLVGVSGGIDPAVGRGPILDESRGVLTLAPMSS